MIELDQFAQRQFNKDFKGTNLSKIDQTSLINYLKGTYIFAKKNDGHLKDDLLLLPSSWEFCKYLVVKNPYADLKTQVLPITTDIYPFIRTGYSSRTPEELPVLSRWVELPPGISLPMANYIVCVLYSREQLKREHDKKYSTDKDASAKKFALSEDTEYGIVAIMGTTEPAPDPLVPVTSMRNALGLEEGGNGEKLDRAMYIESAKFWDRNILVKG